MTTYRQCISYSYTRLERLFLVALTLVLLFATSNAFAQRTVTLWVVDAPPREAQEQEAVLARVLGGARSTQHIVGKAGLEEASRQGAIHVPGCLDGTSPCPESSTALVLQALQANVFVRLQIEANGRINATAFDESGAEIQTVRGEGRNNQAAMSNIVAQLTGATGTLVVDSTPRGARVILNGEDVGATPLSRSVSVGAWDVELRLPGWGAPPQTIVVSPSSAGRVHFTLARNMASLTVRSGTPGAFVVIDGKDQYSLNDQIWLEPGLHEVSVQAPGYSPNTQTLEFVAGIDRELRSTLYISRAEQTRRKIATIQNRPVLVQAGLRYSGSRSDWSTGRIRNGVDDGIRCVVSDTDCARTRQSALGFDLEAIYSWKYLELQPLGLSVYGLMTPDSARAQLEENSASTYLLDRANRVQFRLGHVGGHYFVNEYLEPYGRLGFTLGFDRLHLLDEVTAESLKAKRTSFMMEARAGARVHFNELVYSYAEIGVGFEFVARHTKPAFELGAGIGVTLENPFATREASQRSRAIRRESQEVIPEEL